jgi:hypothetical protein
LKGAYYRASLLPRCPGYGDHFLIYGFHMQCLTFSMY